MTLALSSIPELETTIDIRHLFTKETLPNHKLGLTSLKKEACACTTTIKGTFPAWLKGSFLAIGPGVFELQKSSANHWLDGFGMIHRFSIQDGTITYSNKIINSTYYQECCKSGKLRGSIPEKKQSTWSKLTSAMSSSSKRPVYDNTNINIACMNNEIVAITETPHHLKIDNKTLATTGKVNFDDTLEAHFSCAHPLYDPATQEWFGVAIQYAHTSNYIVYKIKNNTSKRITLATIPAGYPSYMHSFALTKNYIILTETPLIVSPYDLLLSDHSFLDTFNWTPKNGTNFIVITRATGKKVGTYKVDPFFTLHHVNAQEKNGQLLIDLIAYKDAEIITKTFNYKNLCQSKMHLPSSYLKRFTINPKNNKVSISLLADSSIELPHINQAYFMKDYRYVYATGSDQSMANQLTKIDLSTKQHLYWKCNGCFPTEPIFIASPQAMQEDEGVILSLVLDACAQKSFLLVLDAQTFKELGRAYVCHHIPFTIHSKFF